MLHLHRFEHHQPLTGSNRVSIGYIDRNHLARHRRDDVAVMRVVMAGAARGPVEFESLPVRENDHAFGIDKAGCILDAWPSSGDDGPAISLARQMY